jgi:Zn-dependent protease
MTNIPLARIAGFAVKVNWSVLVILWLFTWSLASSLPVTAPGYTTRTYWLAGLCGATVLLASLLAHELAHAIVARRAGVKVVDVTLWLLGGVTRLGNEATTPQTAFRIAVAGPVTSLVLAALFATAGWELQSLGVARIAVGVAWWLAGINALLGVFNLLPGAPLDGGQVLRAWLWCRAECGAGRTLRRVLPHRVRAVRVPGRRPGGRCVAGIRRLVHPVRRAGGPGPGADARRAGRRACRRDDDARPT